MKTATKRAEPSPADTQQTTWDDERLTDASHYARRLTQKATECKARKVEARARWAESRQEFLEAARLLDEHAAAWCAAANGTEDRSMFATASRLRTDKEQKRELMLEARQQFFLAKSAHEVAQHKAEEFYDPAKSALPLWESQGIPTPPLDPVAETQQESAGEDLDVVIANQEAAEERGRQPVSSLQLPKALLAKLLGGCKDGDVETVEELRCYLLDDGQNPWNVLNTERFGSLDLDDVDKVLVSIEMAMHLRICFECQAYEDDQAVGNWPQKHRCPDCQQSRDKRKTGNHPRYADGSPVPGGTPVGDTSKPAAKARKKKHA